MDLGIAGRRAAVAAASTGLGYATAEALVQEGVRVVICGRERGRIEEAARKLGEQTRGIVADVSRPEGARAFANGARDALGGIDILIANVGGPPPGTAHAVDFDGLRDALDRCLLSMVAMCQEVLPGMREQGWGRIVAITSIGVRQPLANMVYSNSSRAGLTGYLKTLAREVIGDGVTVNSLLPSMISTQRMRELGPDVLAQAMAATPAQRMGRREDFGRVAAFLCSQSAEFISGVAVPVDGGADAALI